MHFDYKPLLNTSKQYNEMNYIRVYAFYFTKVGNRSGDNMKANDVIADERSGILSHFRFTT